MRPFEGVGVEIMVKELTVAIDPVMAGKTILTEGLHMFYCIGTVDLFMANLAGILVECSQI